MALTKATEVVITLTSPTIAGTTTHTGPIQLVAGDAGTAPLVFGNSATIKTTPTAGSFEYNGTSLYMTNSGGARKALVYGDGTNASGSWAISITGTTAKVNTADAGGSGTYYLMVSNSTAGTDRYLYTRSNMWYDCASNKISVNITGNCDGTAVYASYLNGTQQNNVITGVSNPVYMSTSSDGRGSFVCRASGGGDSALAGLTFYNDSYAIKMGVRADGYCGIGGWSRPAWSWYTDPSGNMTAAGDVTAYSDPRLKENFTKINDPISIVKQLDGGTFNWKSGITHTAIKAGKKDYGVLANQVEAVMPEIVTESIELEGNKYKTVAYEKIVPLLIECIKAQQEQIDELKVRVEKL
jgi:hypothetical protein